jgi:hypothetical protein
VRWFGGELTGQDEECDEGDADGRQTLDYEQPIREVRHGHGARVGGHTIAIQGCFRRNACIA